MFPLTLAVLHGDDNRGDLVFATKLFGVLD